MNPQQARILGMVAAIHEHVEKERHTISIPFSLLADNKAVERMQNAFEEQGVCGREDEPLGKFCLLPKHDDSEPCGWSIASSIQKVRSL